MCADGTTSRTVVIVGHSDRYVRAVRRRAFFIFCFLLAGPHASCTSRYVVRTMHAEFFGGVSASGASTTRYMELRSIFKLDFIFLR
jgi:hypothetical protein